MTETLPLAIDATVWAAQAEGRVITPGGGAALVVPSGQGITLHETILDRPTPDMAIYRFRYLAPAISRSGGTMTFETSIVDMQHLCDTHALPNMDEPLAASVQVIISFADLPVPFGETNPEVTQFFVAFNVKDGVCHLEPF